MTIDEWTGDIADLISRIEKRQPVHNSDVLDGLAKEIVEMAPSDETAEQWTERLGNILSRETQ